MRTTKTTEEIEPPPTLPDRNREEDLRAILRHVLTEQKPGTYDIVKILRFPYPGIAVTKSEREYVVSLQKEFNEYATEILNLIEER